MDRLVGVLQRARALGFLGPGAVEAHIEHALGFAAAFSEAPPSFVDLGSGGGVPGLVLLEVWPGSRAVLLDANERRTTFLAEALTQLDWADRAEVVRLRAEEAGRDGRFRAMFPAVVARGFASPPVTAECAAPLLAVGGTLVVSEPPEEVRRWPVEGLQRVGLAPAGVWAGTARFQVLVQLKLCPATYPRRVGIPAKRPLW